MMKFYCDLCGEEMAQEIINPHKRQTLGFLLKPQKGSVELRYYGDFCEPCLRRIVAEGTLCIVDGSSWDSIEYKNRG